MSEPENTVVGVAFTGLQRAVDEACKTIDKLRTVAEAARALTDNAEDLGLNSVVREKDLVALESALEAAGYGMTDEEFDRRIRAGMRRLDELGELPK